MKTLAAYVLMLVVVLAGGVGAQTPEERFEDRLSTLTPSNPAAYYLLAEEVAYAASTPGELDLARHLYVLAFVLSDRDPGVPWLRPSSCVALAALEVDPARRRWLYAVAALIDDRYTGLAAEADHLAEVPAPTRLAFAEFLGLTRAGRGALARQRLELPGMDELIDAISSAVVGNRSVPSINRMRSEAGVWPCKQCSNARSVPDPSSPETERVLCPNCRGNPGPLLDTDDLVAYTALEAIVLRADGRTWSAEHAMLRTGPLRDPDLGQVPRMFAIDPTRSVYNSGQWVTPDPDT